MSINPSLDPPPREFLQSIFSSAFQVQESGIAAHLHSAVAEIQQLISSADSEPDHVMHVIADHACKVANATGVCIALLERDQLVYRAASGSAGEYVGKHARAILSMPRQRVSHREILRVENAHADSRIEAAICRELGAMSLLILPIVHSGTIAGVLQILFSEPHTFVEREVSAYGMIAGLIEEVISRKIGSEETSYRATSVLAVPNPPEYCAPRTEVTGYKQKAAIMARLKSAIGQSRLTGALVGPQRLKRRLKYFWHVATASRTTSSLPRPLLDTIRWNLAPVLIVATLIIVNWIAHRPVSSGENSPPAKSTVAVPVSPTASNRSRKDHSSALPTSAAAAATEQRFPGSGFRRVRASQNEIDYIAEDVTIRHFGPNNTLRRVSVPMKQINIGDDVTVRYFESEATHSTEPVTTDSPQVSH